MRIVFKGEVYKAEKSDTQGRPTKYPWSEMEVNDFFEVFESSVLGRRQIIRAKNSAITSARHYESKNTGKKFRSKLVFSDGQSKENSVTITRIQ